MAGTMATGHRNNLLGLLVTDAQFHFQFISREPELVIINKAIGASIIGRINIDALDLPRITLDKMMQCIQIISTDVNVLARSILGQGIMFDIRPDYCGRLER